MSKFSCPNCKTKVSFFKALMISRSSEVTCSNCQIISSPIFWKPGLTSGLSGAISSLVIIFGSWEIIKGQGLIIGAVIVLLIIVTTILTLSFVVYKTTNLVRSKESPMA